MVACAPSPRRRRLRRSPRRRSPPRSLPLRRRPRSWVRILPPFDLPFLTSHQQTLDRMVTLLLLQLCSIDGKGSTDLVVRGTRKEIPEEFIEELREILQVLSQLDSHC